MSYVVVPLRVRSQRLPEKIFADICGKPLCVRAIEKVFASVEQCRSRGRWTVVAAVDEDRTEKLLKAHFPNLRVVLTGPELPSGTDRVHAAVNILGSAKPEDLVVNVQGDMPHMSPRHTGDFLDWCVETRPAFGTLAHEWPRDQGLEDRAHVKALVNSQGRAIYFSRFALPYSRVEPPPEAPPIPWYHVGIYAYTWKQLSEFCAWPPSPLEKFEGLEQLRALDRGVAIEVQTFANTDLAHSFRGIDTPADLEWARGMRSDG